MILLQQKQTCQTENVTVTTQCLYKNLISKFFFLHSEPNCKQTAVLSCNYWDLLDTMTDCSNS